MAKQAQPCQHLDCDIPPRQLPNVTLVNEASNVKWFAQVHNTLAVAGLGTRNLCTMSPAFKKIKKIMVKYAL